MKRNTVKLGDDGIACPRCAKPMEVRAHKEVTAKMLGQPYYLRQWFYCGKPPCPTKEVNRVEDRVCARAKDDRSVKGDQMEPHELRRELERIAIEHHGGHLTVLRFTSNWRVGFGTPGDALDIGAMPAGRTFDEAARAALKRPRERSAENGGALRAEFGRGHGAPTQWRPA